MYKVLRRLFYQPCEYKVSHSYKVVDEDPQVNENHLKNNQVQDPVLITHKIIVVHLIYLYFNENNLFFLVEYVCKTKIMEELETEMKKMIPKFFCVRYHPKLNYSFSQNLNF